MSWISAIVWGMNVWISSCWCHYPVSGLKRSHTLMLFSASGLNCGGCGSHLWSSILMLFPSPTFHTVAARIRSVVSSSLLHTNEGLFPISTSINEQLGKQHTLYTLKNREWLPWISHHACFFSMARLNAWMSLNPIPPLSFGLHNLLHLIQWIIFSFHVWPHQYFANAELILSHILFEILNMLME